MKFTEELFKILIENAKLQTGNDTDSIGYCSDYGNTSISWHCDRINGFDATVLHFGITVGSNWVQYEPTQHQINQMEMKCFDHAMIIFGSENGKHTTTVRSYEKPYEEYDNQF